MSARKIDSFPIQLLGLSMIVADHELQSRVATNMEYQREFSEAMRNGAEFPAVVVFFDGKTYWLADGFHRYGARKILARADKSFDQIRAEIHSGTSEDAKVYSAGANQKFSIPRSLEDKKRSVWMLMDIVEWRTKSAGIIKSHTGINRTTIIKWRDEYLDEHNLPRVEIVERSDGLTQFASTFAKHNSDPRIYISFLGRDQKIPCYVFKYNSKRIYLCSTKLGEEKAREVLARKIEVMSRSTRDHVFNPREGAGFARTLNAYGISCKLLFDGLPNKYRPGIVAVKGVGFVAACTDFVGADSTLLAASRVLHARQILGVPCRMVVVCYPDKGPKTLMGHSSAMGVEWMTIEDFAASLKAGPTGDDAA